MEITIQHFFVLILEMPQKKELKFLCLIKNTNNIKTVFKPNEPCQFASGLKFRLQA